MGKSVVAIVRYEEPLVSVQRAVELSAGLKGVKPGDKVFIKPNIVFWTRAVSFPKWGVITTSRVVEDMVRILKDCGVSEITIGEGIITAKNDFQTPRHAFKSLGYERLQQRYGVRTINVMEESFERVDLGDGISLRFNSDILHSDLVVDLPVLKSHNQTVVSLGIKNLKGTIDIPSRKKCHNADPKKDLHFHVARLADRLPPMFTLIDGIYSLERGPSFDGRIHRTNILIASADVFAADKVGAKVLGFEPTEIPYLVHAAKNRKRSLDLSDIQIRGESLEQVGGRRYEYDFSYAQSETGIMPVPLAKMGIQGLFYHKYDTTMCTYCSALNGVVLSAIKMAWEGKPWDKVEVLTGKKMQPTPGMSKTILLGQCMYKANKNHPAIKELIAVKGCPPDPREVVQALHRAGIKVDPGLFEHMDTLPGFFMDRYKDKPEFDESFFQIVD